MTLALRVALASLMCLLVVACGGGGDPIQPPIAVAGEAQSVMAHSTVELDGSGSSDPQQRPLSFHWRLQARPAGSAASIVDATAVRPWFGADVVGTYVVALTVDNGLQSSADSLVTITVTPDIRVAAAKASLSAVVDLERHTLRLEWLDKLPDGTLYHIEALDAAGIVEPLESLAGAGGIGALLRWERAIDASMSLRVRASFEGSNAFLQTDAGPTVLPIVLPQRMPSIVLNQVEPISGWVALSVGDAAAYSRVLWYVDSGLLDSSIPSWDTSSTPAGPHLLAARLEIGPSTFLELRRIVVVTSTEISLYASTSDGPSGQLWLLVRASSDFGIKSVEAVVDGVSLGTLTSPNFCSKYCIDNVDDLYGYLLDKVALGSGKHAFTVTVTDHSLAVRTQVGSLTVNNAPVLEIDAPIDGLVADSTLAVAGRFGSDKQGLVTVVATLGAREVLSTTSSPFSADFSLAGIEPGNHTLTVRATDSEGIQTVVQRTVNVAGPVPPATLLSVLGEPGELLAAGGDEVLWRASDNIVRRSDGSGNPVVLQDAGGIQVAANWQLGGGSLAVADGSGADASKRSVYLWLPDGSITNLSSANPYSAAAQGRRLRSRRRDGHCRRSLSIPAARWDTCLGRRTSRRQGDPGLRWRGHDHAVNPPEQQASRNRRRSRRLLRRWAAVHVESFRRLEARLQRLARKREAGRQRRLPDQRRRPGAVQDRSELTPSSTWTAGSGLPALPCPVSGSKVFLAGDERAPTGDSRPRGGRRAG